MSRMLETARLLREVRDAQRRFIALWALDEHDKRVRALLKNGLPFPRNSRFTHTD